MLHCTVFGSILRRLMSHGSDSDVLVTRQSRYATAVDPASVGEAEPHPASGLADCRLAIFTLDDTTIQQPYGYNRLF
jgi:hypothetical protein